MNCLKASKVFAVHFLPFPITKSLRFLSNPTYYLRRQGQKQKSFTSFPYSAVSSAAIVTLSDQWDNATKAIELSSLILICAFERKREKKDLCYRAKTKNFSNFHSLWFQRRIQDEAEFR